MTNGVWGNGNQHPPESVWLSLSIVPWDPPPCENATTVTETMVCDVNEPESDAAGSLPHYRYYDGTDCYTADEPREANTTCCNVTRVTWTNCSYDPPKTPYVTMQAWRDFQGLGDKSKKGVLSFTIDASWVASTSSRRITSNPSRAPKSHRSGQTHEKKA